ncbi:MAG TPA: GMC family oxidoreductase [Bryobacterales bacterium]|nr:GMC family oxidoreductase [Bryobacterales bacterium]
MQRHDVIIVGSGMTGGAVAWALAEKGISVTVLEAGPALDFARHRGSKHVYELPYHGFNRPGRFPHVTQASEFNANLWADEKQNPYTYPPGEPYYWVRVRLLGGKSLLWGRWSLRLSDYDFRAKEHDGAGDNWPIRYADLEPYYDRADQLLRVTAKPEYLPQLPDNKALADNSPDSLVVSRFKEAAAQMSITVTKPRRATGALASSVNLFFPPAAAAGRLTLVPNAVVREVTIDKKTGLADGVAFVDRITRREYEAKARVVVLGASCLESTRILLNSASRQHPNGLANSSGALGHYLFDQFYVKNVVTCLVPELKNETLTPGMTGGGGYVVRFRNIKEKDKRFRRGYAYDFGTRSTPDAKYFPLYGAALKDAVDTWHDKGFAMTTMGEALPRFENHARINHEKQDAWGIPVLDIRQTYGPNEHAMAKDSMETAEELCHKAGFEVLAKHDKMVPPGESIHEMGACRMGDSRKTSVLNQYNQAHDVKNLFVVDGSSFVSCGPQNPTLTMVALALRASDYLAEQMRQGNL